MRLLYYFWNNLSRISSIFKISIFKILSTNCMKQISANQKFWYCKIIFSSTTPMLFSYQETQKAAASSDTLWNPGSFLAIVRQVKHLCLLLDDHIHSTLRKGFFYISPISQNEMIGIVAKCTIQISLKK